MLSGACSYWGVGQLADRRTVNPEVAGSSPAAPALDSWTSRSILGRLYFFAVLFVMPKAGIVTVVGKPNVGKSTLLNRIIGEKLSITSPKPQSTRARVVGIYTTDEAQMVILDTPGLLNPRYALQEAMRTTALRAIDDADVVVYLGDATEGKPEPLITAAALEKPLTAPVVVALNKSDSLSDANRRDLAADGSIKLVSALNGEGVAEL